MRTTFALVAYIISLAYRTNFYLPWYLILAIVVLFLMDLAELGATSNDRKTVQFGMFSRN